MIEKAYRKLEHASVCRIRYHYARALYSATVTTLDDLNEAVTTLEDAERTARRVLGGANPVTVGVGRELLRARVVLRARETLSPGITHH